MDDLDEQGTWWLPEQPDRKVPGRLTYTVTDGARLSLIGSFREMLEEGSRKASGAIVFTEDDLDRAGSYPRIHGQVGPKAITLDDCFRTRITRNLFGGLASETVVVNRIYRGVWFEPDEDAGGHRISARLLHLVYWVRQSGLAEEWRPPAQPGPNIDRPIATVTANAVPDFKVELPDGVSLTIGQTLGFSGDRMAGRSITQDFKLRFEAPEVRQLRELIALVSDAQGVISIGLDRTACLESVVLSHPDVVHERRQQEPVELPIEVLAQWADRPGWREPKELHSTDMLYSLPDLEGEEGLQRLLVTAAKYRTELSRVMATRNGRPMYASDRLLNRAAALESLDRTRTGHANSKFATRIRRCIVLAGAPFEHLVVEPDDWVTLFKARRDLTAHHLSGLPDEDGFVDHVMAEAAYYLFVLCLLREATVPSRIFSLIEMNSRVRWIAKQLPAVLGVAR